MKTIAMAVVYDGTAYHGWQRQKNAVTVQQTIEEALCALTRESVQIVGCSRTDAGVHALDYVFHFQSHTEIPVEKLPYALNYHLGTDICVLAAWEMPEDFHARFSARGKEYHYRIWNRPMPNPFLTRYSWHVPYHLDVAAMKKAAPAMEGTHDFAGFMASGGDQKTTVRTVRLSEVCEDPQTPGLITVKIAADAFLYNMVRIMTGTLVEIGLGKIPAEELPAIIASCDRRRGGRTAPPQGLFLKQVYYDFRPNPPREDR